VSICSAIKLQTAIEIYKRIAVNIAPEKTFRSTHVITNKVIQLIKKNSRISDAELAEQAGLQSEAQARGWRVVAEETMRGWKLGY
jgi:hypothetical protein